jgi:arsenate reductase
MKKFYGYKKCGTCSKAEKHLKATGMEYEYIDITINPPSKKELKAIIEFSNKPYKKALNTSGVVYREQGLKDKVKTMSDAELLEVLNSSGKLLKRPMVIEGNKATIGYNSEEFALVWG